MAEQEFTTEELANEIWRQIAGYEGYYSVSDLGRVRRDADGTSTRKGRILKPNPTTGGYVRVSLSVRNNIRNFRIHTLVCRAFLGAIPKGLMPNHKDLDKTNNRVTNFEYVTPLQNKHHAMAHGHESRGPKHGALVKAATARGNGHYARQRPELLARGACHGNAKLTDDKVREIRRLITLGVRHGIIAAQFLIDRSTVSDIGRYKIWRHV